MIFGRGKGNGDIVNAKERFERLAFEKDYKLHCRDEVVMIYS